MGALKVYLPLFKLRICSLITVSALVGLFSVSYEAFPARAAFFLILATMGASAASSAFNHYFDRDMDALMARTSKRPLPFTGGKGAKIALASAILLSIASIALSIFTLNYMAALHLFLGAFVYAVVYTVWLKRRSWMNIIVGGLAGSFAVLAGGASVSPELCALPALLALVMFFWTPTHFWSFAIVHKDDYGKAGIPMLPNVVGNKRTAKYILANTTLLVLSSLLPTLFGYAGLFYAVVASIAGIWFLKLNIDLVKDTSRAVAWKNFKMSMAYLSALFIAVVIDLSI